MIGATLGRRCISTSSARRAVYNNICETVGSTPTVKARSKPFSQASMR